jgi:DNA-binding MarR family transcriptional regulator
MPAAIRPARRRTAHRSPEARPPAADADRIVQGLRRVVRALEAFSSEVYRTYGLTAPQLWALKTLQRKGPLSAGRLAEALAVHQSSLSVLIARLEQRGLVRRVRPRQDRRIVELALTSRGRVIAAEAPEPAQGRLLHGLRTMAPPRVRRIRVAIDEIVEIMEASDVEATFFFAGG